MADWMEQLENEIDAAPAPTEAPAPVEPEPLPVEPEPLPAEPEPAEPEPVGATPESEPEPEPASVDHEPAPKAKEPFIPKSRLDEEIEKRRKLEADMAVAKELLQRMSQQQQAPQQQQQAPQQTLDDMIDGLATKEYEALLEGDIAKAKEFRKQSNMLMTRQAQEQAWQASQQTVVANNEEYVFQSRLQQITTEYPVFNADSPEYDEGVANMALAISQGFIQQGVPKSQILDQVLQTMKPLLDARYGKAAQQPSEPPAPIRNVAQKVATAKAQPPATHNAGSVSKAPAKYDVMSMTVEDFEKLPPDEINRMLRGG